MLKKLFLILSLLVLGVAPVVADDPGSASGHGQSLIRIIAGSLMALSLFGYVIRRILAARARKNDPETLRKQVLGAPRGVVSRQRNEDPLGAPRNAVSKAEKERLLGSPRGSIAGDRIDALLGGPADAGVEPVTPSRSSDPAATSGIQIKLDQALSAANRNDFEAAVNIWSDLAAMGNAKAQCNLGRAYANGNGVVRDFNKARRWFEMSAEQGFEAARECILELDALEEPRDELGETDNSGAKTVDRQPDHRRLTLGSIAKIVALIFGLSIVIWIAIFLGVPAAVRALGFDPSEAFELILSYAAPAIAIIMAIPVAYKLEAIDSRCSRCGKAFAIEVVGREIISSTPRIRIWKKNDTQIKEYFDEVVFVNHSTCRFCGLAAESQGTAKENIQREELL